MAGTDSCARHPGPERRWAHGVWSLVAVVATGLWTSQPFAQTTSGNAGTGSMMYNDTATFNCKGCHGTAIATNYNSVRNAANAGGQILYAIGKGMPGTALTSQQANDFAAYIAQSVADPAPVNVPIPFNSAGVDIPIVTITLGTFYGGYQGLEQVTAPGKGTLTINGTTITYKPNSGASGADSFSYRAYRLSPPATAAGTSNTRTVTVLIDPPPLPVITGSFTANGTVGTAFSYQMAATNSPTAYAATGLPPNLSVNTATGLISGTPAQAGTFAITLSASNAVGGGPTQTLMLTIAKGAQSVSFPPQSTPRPFVNGATFAISPLASASTGMALMYSSTTPSVCSVTGTTVTMLAAGNCGLRASQAGDANYLAAAGDQSVFLSAGAPTLVTPRLPAASKGVAYSAGFLIGGAVPPSTVSVSGLPGGLAANHNGNGTVTISGTPTQAGLFSIAVLAGNGGGQLSANISLNVDDPSLYANNVSAVSVRGNTCALLAGGLRCWGDNSYGQLGDGTTTSSALPVVAIAAGASVTAVSAGGQHTCAVVAGGIKCWGANAYGQLGNNSTGTMVSSPVQAIAAGNGATAIAAGLYHSCAVVNGGVRCWGSNSSNQLGTGNGVDSAVPVQTIATGSGATAVSADLFRTCAVVSGGVRCWGSGHTGIETIAGLSGVTALAVSSDHGCVVAAGGVQCWGANYYGQLGNGNLDDSPSPVQTIAPGSGAVTISVGGYSNCAVVNAGVRCWGYNYYGPLGVKPDPGATFNYIENPPITAIADGGGVTSVSTDGYHTCAVVSGRVQCWGYSAGGRLGGPLPTGESHVPALSIASGSGVTGIAAGYLHSCALVAGGVQCWGANYFGQLGNGTKISSGTPVTAIASGSAVSAVATRMDHTCAIVNGAAKCWGYNNFGQIGLGNSTNQTSPQQVYELTSGVTAIAPGGTHTCALVSGAVRCWGGNDAGQLGEGHNSYIYTPGVPTVTNGTATSLASGAAHSCAVAGGGVQCWGDNSSRQLGVAFGLGSNVPVQTIATGSGITTVQAGNGNGCAIINGGVSCWGNLYYANLNTPTSIIATGSGVSAMTSGGGHLCVLINGGVQCWSNNNHGQVGDDSTATRSAPVQVIPAGSNVTAIAAGSSHTCAVINGGVVCWGLNDALQLANAQLAPAIPGATRVFAEIPATLAAQLIGFGSVAGRTVADPSFLLSAVGGGSGNPVVFSSQTSAICTTSGTNGSIVTLTGTPGTCTIASNQAGNANYAAAVTVTQSFAVTPSTYTITPSAGANGTIIPSSPQAVLPGGAITFTVTPDAGYGATVGGTCGGSLVGDMFTTSAVNANCTVAASFAPLPVAPGLVSVLSRKTHGAAGPLDIAIDLAAAIGGNVTTEPRAIGGGHMLMFQFDAAVTAVSGATAVDAGANPVGTINAVAAGGNWVAVTLTGIADATRVRVRLPTVNGLASNAAASVGFLLGDVNNSRGVTSGDITAIRARSGEAAAQGNARFDVNASGVIGAADVVSVKRRVGNNLP